VAGRVRREPAERLDPLPLRADRLAATGLVCVDDRVNETLEEVALLVRRDPPRGLEGLVGGEELTAEGEP
jgi:hypothetical protein